MLIIHTVYELKHKTQLLVNIKEDGFYLKSKHQTQNIRASSLNVLTPIPGYGRHSYESHRA